MKKNILLITLTFLLKLFSFANTWTIPAGVNLVASPVSGLITDILSSEQISKITSIYYISKEKPRWQYYGNDENNLETLTEFKQNHGYIINSQNAINIDFTPDSMPQIIDTTGFQITPLVAFSDSEEKNTTDIITELGENLNSIFTLYKGEWLYYSSKDLGLDSIKPLTKVTSQMAYFVSFAPENVFPIIDPNSEYEGSNEQITLGSIPLEIISINNGEALLKSKDNVELTYDDWPESIKFQLSAVNNTKEMTSNNFEFRLSDNSSANFIWGQSLYYKVELNNNTTIKTILFNENSPVVNAKYEYKLGQNSEGSSDFIQKNAIIFDDNEDPYSLEVKIKYFFDKVQGETDTSPLRDKDLSLTLDLGQIKLQPLGYKKTFSKIRINNLKVNKEN